MSLKTLEKPSGVETCMPVFSGRFTNTTYFLPVITHPSIFFPANPLSTIVPLPPLAVDSAATAARCLSIVPLPPLAVDWARRVVGETRIFEKGRISKCYNFCLMDEEKSQKREDFKVLQVLIHGRVLRFRSPTPPPPASSCCLLLLTLLLLRRIGDRSPREKKQQVLQQHTKALHAGCVALSHDAEPFDRHIIHNNLLQLILHAIDRQQPLVLRIRAAQNHRKRKAFS
jgi:hypothetical protein